MAEPTVVQKCPYVVEEEPKKIWWCSCGESKTQPYCDGAHKGSEFSPVLHEVEAKKKVAWCGCKKTGTPPFCDGSHSKL
jgi:CDGSH iron-sulfur domain-containing protein 3